MVNRNRLSSNKIHSDKATKIFRVVFGAIAGTDILFIQTLIQIEKLNTLEIIALSLFCLSLPFAVYVLIINMLGINRKTEVFPFKNVNSLFEAFLLLSSFACIVGIFLAVYQVSAIAAYAFILSILFLTTVFRKI